MPGEEYDGANVQEQLKGACMRNNVDLLDDLIEEIRKQNPEDEDAALSSILNNTRDEATGNHLYHIAAKHGNWLIMDKLLDQPDFECDPTNRAGETPLHTFILWVKQQQGQVYRDGVGMTKEMLDSGSDPRIKIKGRVTTLDVVGRGHDDLRAVVQEAMDAPPDQDDVPSDPAAAAAAAAAAAFGGAPPASGHDGGGDDDDDDDDDAEFSGSDDEERAAWEARRAAKGR